MNRRSTTGEPDGGEFAGKVAFVTGSASGIGRATALAFAREAIGATTLGVLSIGGESEPGASSQAPLPEP
jgi:NAD(P)-dependent dehydrogenase (short-subunit alcohol dehydrogenase family)